MNTTNLDELADLLGTDDRATELVAMPFDDWLGKLSEYRKLADQYQKDKQSEIKAIRGKIDGLEAKRGKLSADLQQVETEHQKATDQAAKAMLNGGNLDKLSASVAAWAGKRAILTAAMTEVTNQIAATEHDLMDAEAQAAGRRVADLMIDARRIVADISRHYLGLTDQLDALTNTYQDAVEIDHRLATSTTPLRLTAEASRIRAVASVVSDFLFQYGRLVEGDREYYGIPSDK